MSLPALIAQNGTVITEGQYKDLTDKSGWVYHETYIPPGRTDPGPGGNRYEGGYAGYYQYVSKPADAYPYTYVWDPQTTLAPPAGGYWTDYGRGSWARATSPDPSFPSDYHPPVAGDTSGSDPWAQGGPGTPGWGNPPFYPEYNKSTVYYPIIARPSYRSLPPLPYRGRKRFYKRFFL